MAIDSSVSGYTNIGHDLTLTLTGPDGVAIVIPNLMSFEHRQVTADITHMRMDGTTLVADLPKLWEGTIEFQRRDGGVDDSFQQIQDLWLANQDYVLGTLVIHVASAKENRSFTFLDTSVRLEDGGTWRGDEVTRVRIAFRAGRKVAA